MTRGHSNQFNKVSGPDVYGGVLFGILGGLIVDIALLLSHTLKPASADDPMLAVIAMGILGAGGLVGACTGRIITAFQRKPQTQQP